MKSATPKQFLPLLNRQVLDYSLDLFLNDVGTTAGVCLVIDPSQRSRYSARYPKFLKSGALTFASPGKERQDSVLSGLTSLSSTNAAAAYAAVHDSARPLVTPAEVLAVVADAKEHGAAVLAVPCKGTIKRAAEGQFVEETPDRAMLYEAQTPQVALISLLLEGFEHVDRTGAAVTDDVSVIEALGLPVKITVGEYENIKITTPGDLKVAEGVLVERRGGLWKRLGRRVRRVFGGGKVA